MKIAQIIEANHFIERIKTLEIFIELMKSQEEAFCLRVHFEALGTKTNNFVSTLPKFSTEIKNNEDNNFLIEQATKRINYLKNQITKI